jgi:hypothetical protein
MVIGTLTGLHGTIGTENGTLNGLHGTIGTVNGTLGGLYGTIGTVNGTLNGLHGTIRTENGWNGLNALASISKFAFRKLSLLFSSLRFVYLFTNIKYLFFKIEIFEIHTALAHIAYYTK